MWMPISYISIGNKCFQENCAERLSRDKKIVAELLAKKKDGPLPRGAIKNLTTAQESRYYRERQRIKKQAVNDERQAHEDEINRLKEEINRMKRAHEDAINTLTTIHREEVFNLKMNMKDGELELRVRNRVLEKELSDAKVIIERYEKQRNQRPQYPVGQSLRR